MNAAVKKLRGMNPNANWKGVNGANLTNGQKKVLNGLKLGAAYVGMTRQKAAQAASIYGGNLFKQAQAPIQTTAPAANMNASALFRQKRQATAPAANMNASALFTQAQTQRPANQGPKRNLKEIYEFPKEGTLKEVIQAVSQDVWKHFESRKDADEIAWLVLKSRGQTVNRTPYRAGFIMDQYNWKELYDRFKGGSTPVKYKQIMRYILAMLALNPPYANRKTGNRNKLSGQPRIATMNNAAFNAYLKALAPVANQGGGLAKAFLRTTASGAGLVTRTAINKKAIVLPIAAAALTAGLAGGPAAAGTAARMAAKQALKTAVVGGLKSKFGNNPISNAVINKAVSLAETKITSQTAPTNDSIKTAIANAANTASGLPNVPEPAQPVRPSNALINAKVQQARRRIYMNIGPYAGNEYGTRNQRADKGAEAIRKYYRNVVYQGKNINKNSQVQSDVKNLIRVAVYPRSTRPPHMSNMAWAAAGALLATAAAVPVAYAVTGGAGGTVAGAAAKKAANLARQQAAKKAVQTTKGMAASRATQAARQGVAKAGPRAASQVARRAGNLNRAKMNFVKKLLNRAARGNHTITPNMINKAVQRAGGDPRVAVALEKGGQVARNLLASL